MTTEPTFTEILFKDEPDAIAWIIGNEAAPYLNGSVKFFSTPYKGVLIETEVFGLPNDKAEPPPHFFAMHIHEMGDCTMPFDHTGSHYNPQNTTHPYHAGDLPPLLGNQGYAFNAFFTKQFSIYEIIGRSVIIHSQVDDFMTQPSGNSGDKIGCGTILTYETE